jgi:hypothetical protein
MDVGDRLPDVRLTRHDGKLVDLASPRGGAPMLLFSSSTGSPGAPYVSAFLAEAGTLELWSARPLVLVRSAQEAAALGESIGSAARVAIDDAGEMRERVGVEDAFWGLVIADRWGIVYHIARAKRAEDLPDMGELREWAKFLATQCPECGVIDWPA